jgi:hypothetical protein
MKNPSSLIGFVLFVLGILPLLAFTFLSPGLTSEGKLGFCVVIFSVVTLGFLVGASRSNRRMILLVVLQLILIGLVLFETFSDSALYIGT